MLGKNIEVKLNINSTPEAFEKCKNYVNKINGYDVNIKLTNNNPYTPLSCNLPNDNDETIKRLFNFKTLILKNGVNVLSALVFKNLGLIVSNSFYGVGNINPDERSASVFNLPGKVKMSLVKAPYEEDSYFYFTTFPFLENTSSMYRFREARYFKCEKLKLLTPIVSKNCCSSVINLFYNNDIKRVGDQWEPWDGGNNKDVYNSSIYVPSHQLKEVKYNDYRTFIILRDPIKRFLSIVNYTKGRYNAVGLPYMFPYMFSLDKNLIIEVVLAITKGLNALDDIYYHDDHYMTQAMHLSGVDLMKIDDIVLSSDVSRYFKEVHNVDFPTVNENKEKFVTIEDLTEDQINEVKALFKDDFLLINHTKLWNH